MVDDEKEGREEEEDEEEEEKEELRDTGQGSQAGNEGLVEPASLYV